MIKLEGTILNVFTQQGGKDRKTGDQFEDRDKGTNFRSYGASKRWR